jgi:hypothetical protein
MSAETSFGKFTARGPDANATQATTRHQWRGSPRRLASYRYQTRRSAWSIQTSIRLVVATSPSPSQRSWAYRMLAISA